MVFKNLLKIFLLVLAIGQTSCKLIEGSAEVPAYLYIKPIGITVEPNFSQGQASIDSNDVWAFDNGRLLGTFKTPALIPVIKKGETSIWCNHGIKQTGQDEERIIYPMLATFKQTLNLQPNKIDTITPIVTYVPNARFPLIEDFDKPGFAFEYNLQYKQQGDTILAESGETAWDKTKKSGKVVLLNDSSYLEIYSKVFGNFKKFTPTYLEVDYKCNIQFIAGLYITEPDGNVSQIPVFGFYPKNDWSKVYINIESEIASKNAGSDIRIFFRFSKMFGSAVNPEIWLDNIKLIYLD